MYIPPLNLMSDKHDIVVFMQRFSFATIITAKDAYPIASHLPFVVTENGEDIILTSHVAMANPQWQDLVDQKVLVIFSEPHAYISPTLYEKELNVPTWNYIAVHAYGKAVLIKDAEQVRKVLETTIDQYEPAYKEQWDRLPDVYKTNMMKGIVAFEIRVSEVQGKKKLSQNKTAHEQEKIRTALSISEDGNARLIGEYMIKNLKT